MATSVYKNSSPYYLTNVYNGSFLDFMIDRPIPMYASDVYMLITQSHHLRPDLLAFDLYGTSSLWWVFTQRNLNVIQDPILDFIPGKQIYICKKNSLFSALGL